MIVDDFTKAVERRDQAALDKALGKLRSQIPKMAPAEVAATAAGLLPVLARLPIGIGSGLAPVIGGMSDYGADPAAILPLLVDRAIGVLADAAGFKTLVTGLGMELPSSGDEQAFSSTVDALMAAPRDGFSERDIVNAAEAWFAGDGWVQPVLYLAQRKEVRAMMPRRAELTAAIEDVTEDLGTAHWLHGLLLVLDDEPLIVLHRASGQAWRCTISGIGDNFQLHTLLAGRLAGFISVAPPTPTELAAAETGDPQPPEGINGNFNLVDAFGGWIWNEGRPADIPRCDGTRVVVIDPAPYKRGWNTGRLYPLMLPALTVDARLTADEAAAWLAKVKPDTQLAKKPTAPAAE